MKRDSHTIALAVLCCFCFSLTGCQDQSPPVKISANQTTASDPAQQPGGDLDEAPVEDDADAAAHTALGADEQAGADELAGGNGNDDSERPQPRRGNPGKAEQVSFDRLIIQIQPDIVVRPWMITDEVRQFDGRNIRVKGYILADGQTKGIKEFILLRNLECKFGQGGQADHLISVTLAEGVTTNYTTKPVEVEGVLKINPFTGLDGNTWSIYDMDATAVKTARR